MAFPVGWLRKCAVTCDHTKVGSGGVSSFPGLLTEIDLPAEMLTLSGGSAAQSDGGDIRFSSDAAGATQLACEVVAWTQDASPALAKAEVWVNCALSSSSDSVIYVWYNAGGAQTQPAASAAFGSQAVWDANFKAVWHLGSTLTPESTSNGNTLTNHGATTTTGKIGGGAAFNGSTQSMSSSATVNLSGGNTATVEYWVNSSDFGTPAKVLLETSSNYNNNVGSMIQDPSGEAAGAWGFIIHGGATNLGYNGVKLVTKPSTGAWHQVVMTVDLGVGTGQAVVVYVDGALAAVTADGATNLSGINLGNFTAFLMSRNNASLFQIGSLDEFRISNSVRSAAWIATEYNNQNAPASFWTVGTPVQVAVAQLAIFENSYRQRR